MTETLDERLSASAHMVERLLSQIPVEQLAQTAKPVVSELSQQNLIACEVTYFSTDVIINQQVVARTKGAPDGLANRPIGFSTWHQNGVEWRSYVLKKDQMQVVAAEKITLRNSLLSEIIKSILYPLILTLIFCIILILWIVKAEFKPIESVSQTLHRHKNSHENELEFLSHLKIKNIPKEIQPFIENIIDLVTRLNESLENEKNFSAYAAHELRSPLTAIKTNVQLSKMIAQQQQQPALVEILDDAERSILRYQNLLENLLVLSQTEHQHDYPIDSVDLKNLLQDVLSQLKSHRSDIDSRLDVAWDSLQTIELSYYSMSIALKNIIENALKHSQSLTKIQIFQIDNCLYIRDFGIGLH